MRRAFLKHTAALGSRLLSGAASLTFPLLASATPVRGAFAQDGASQRLDSIYAMGPFALPAGARVERNLAYGSDPRQRLDVYIPANAQDAPAILMVHGGGWRRGDKQLWRVVKNKVAHWVGRGYLFVSTDYRLVPQADPVGQAHDVARALAFVEANLRSWGGDPARLVMMGHSAGAHLVALLTADPAIAAREGAKRWLGSIALDSGAMDVAQIMRARHWRLYDVAFGSDPAYWRRASPIDRLKGPPAEPILVVCSTRRRESCPQGRAFAAKITQLGGRAQVLLEDLSHAEINDLLGTPGAYTARVDAFLHSLGLP